MGILVLRRGGFGGVEEEGEKEVAVVVGSSSSVDFWSFEFEAFGLDG